jgi:drug/metabolite transporter (DMT)-like permease
MFLLAALTRQRLRPTTTELGLAASSGLLLWVGGNGLVSWAEQRIPSALTALIVGSTPLCIVLVESLVDRRPPPLLVLAMLVGFAGIGLLSARSCWLACEQPLDPGLILAALSWGSAVCCKAAAGGLSVSRSGYQHLLLYRVDPGCLCYDLFLTTTNAWLAWGYSGLAQSSPSPPTCVPCASCRPASATTPMSIRSSLSFWVAYPPSPSPVDHSRLRFSSCSAWQGLPLAVEETVKEYPCELIDNLFSSVSRF